MPPEFHVSDIPETPRYWAELERRLRNATGVCLGRTEAPATPEFEGRLLEHLAPGSYREPRFPAVAAAAMIAIAMCTAVLLQWLPGRTAPAEVAAPGVTRPPVVMSSFEPTPIEIIPFESPSDRSLQPGVQALSEVDRLTANLRDRGHEVQITYRLVTDPSLDGEILEVRHAFETGISVLLKHEAKTPVIVTVAEALPNTRIF